MSNSDNLLELLDIYIDMVEKQDEIIYQLSSYLKDQAIELAHLRNLHDYVGEDEAIDEKRRILHACMKDYQESRQK